MSYSPALLYALVADPAGRIILHTERRKEGMALPTYPGLSQLLDVDPVSLA